MVLDCNINTKKENNHENFLRIVSEVRMFYFFYPIFRNCLFLGITVMQVKWLSTFVLKRLQHFSK